MSPAQRRAFSFPSFSAATARNDSTPQASLRPAVWDHCSAAPPEERNGHQVGQATERPEPRIWLSALAAADLDEPGNDHGNDQDQPGECGRAQVNLCEALVAVGGQPADGLAAPTEQEQEQAEASHDREP